MSDDHQIHMPPSFLALYADPRTRRLREPIAEVRARYEVCEDLATHLVEHACVLAQASAPSEDEVLRRILAGLRAPGACVTEGEARWVTMRLAELLGWELPPLPGG